MYHHWMCYFMVVGMRNFFVIWAACLASYFVGLYIHKPPTLEQTINSLPAFAKHDIAYNWCTQSVEARKLCASWKVREVQPMDGK